MRTGTIGLLGALSLLSAQCHPNEKTGLAPETPSPLSPPAMAATPATVSSIKPQAPPLSARFVELSPDTTPVPSPGCSETLVAVARGHMNVAGDQLANGDILVSVGTAPMDLRGDGLALVVQMPFQSSHCAGKDATLRRIVRASAAKELTWADGKMHAHLDVEKEISPELYLGRLEGSAPVAEHTHASSWEILGAIDAAGTFTLNGEPTRLGPRMVAAVPPGTTHSWKPDAGSQLVAFQMYVPPGPEQRFRVLAAAAHDAGAERR